MNRQGTMQLQELLNQFKLNNHKKPGKNPSLIKRDSEYSKNSSVDDSKNPKKLHKIQRIINQNLGLDFPNKKQQFKVYLTAQKEYQDALKLQK